MKSRHLLFVVLLAACSVQAATLTINVTRDLVVNPSGWVVALPGGAVSVAAGDHVDYTLDFLGNQTLTIGNGTEYLNLWMYGPGNNSFFTIENIVVELLGFSGTGGAASQYALGTQSAGQAHIGPQLMDFLTAGQTVTFTGVSVSYDVQSLAASPYVYTKDWLIYDGSGVQVGTQPVPEDSSALALLALGLAVLGIGRIPQFRCVGLRPARGS